MRWVKMSSNRLPEGVEPTNSKPLMGGASFSVPNVATPEFAKSESGASHAKVVHEKREVYERVTEEDDDDDNKGSNEDEDFLHAHDHRGPSSAYMLMVAIGLLLAALALIVIANSRQSTPLCSEQPAWNQYNCRPG